MPDFDCIIIGAGVGGLTAGAYLTQKGKRILIVDGQDKVGGYCTAFLRDGFQFDVAVHMVGGIMCDMFKAFGIDLEWYPVDPLYRILSPHDTFDCPATLSQLTKTLTQMFPSEVTGIHQFSSLIEANWRAVRASWYPLPPENRTDESLPRHLFKYHNQPYATLLDDVFQDAQLKNLMSALCTYGGLPPERLSALYMLGILGSYFVDGAYFPRGGSQALADALADSIVVYRGVIELNQYVEEICLDASGGVTGVKLNDGRVIRSETVISNADAYHTFERLIGAERLPSQLHKRLQTLEPSMSAFQVFLGIDTAVDLPLETFYFSQNSYDEMLSATRDGVFDQAGISITNPTAIDASLAPNGCSVLNLIAAIPATLQPKFTRETIVEKADLLIDVAAKCIPNLRDHIQHVEHASPATFEKFTRNRQGACYGWAMISQQMGSRRLRAKTVFDGLYLAGHWTNPGGGIVSVAQSGIRAAKYVINHQKSNLG